MFTIHRACLVGPAERRLLHLKLQLSIGSASEDRCTTLSASRLTFSLLLTNIARVHEYFRPVPAFCFVSKRPSQLPSTSLHWIMKVVLHTHCRVTRPPVGQANISVISRLKRGHPISVLRSHSTCFFQENRAFVLRPNFVHQWHQSPDTGYCFYWRIPTVAPSDGCLISTRALPRSDHNTILKASRNYPNVSWCQRQR